MALKTEDMPDTAQMAMEWSTLPRHGETGVFDEDREIVERIRSITAAVLDCNLTDKPEILKGLLMVLGYVSPAVHCPLLLALGQESPKAVDAAFRSLERGTEAERFAYASLLETFGRFARHGLFIDVMSDEEAIEDVRNAIKIRSGGKT